MAIVRGGFAAMATGTTAAIDTTGATLIVVAVAGDLTGFTMSDSKSNTWTPLTSAAGGSAPRSGLFYAVNPTVGSGHTFTGPQVYSAIGAVWYTGASATPFDQESGTSTSPATSIAIPSITPSENNELVLSAFAVGDCSAISVSSGTPTVVTSLNGVAGVTWGGGIAEVIQTTAASVAVTWSWTSVSFASGVMASFKAAAAAAGGYLLVKN